MFFRVTRPPCCIDPKVHRIVWTMQSGTDLKGVRLFRYKVISTQMEVDFDTHLKSIRHKLKSIRHKLKSCHSKSERAEMHVSQWKSFMFASHMIAIDRKNAIPEGEESCLSGGLETFYSSWIRWSLVWDQPDSKGSQTNLTVEQIVRHRLLILSVQIL